MKQCVVLSRINQRSVCAMLSDLLNVERRGIVHHQRASQCTQAVSVVLPMRLVLKLSVLFTI